MKLTNYFPRLLLSLKEQFDLLGFLEGKSLVYFEVMPGFSFLYFQVVIGCQGKQNRVFVFLGKVAVRQFNFYQVLDHAGFQTLDFGGVSFDSEAVFGPRRLAGLFAVFADFYFYFVCFWNEDDAEESAFRVWNLLQLVLSGVFDDLGESQPLYLLGFGLEKPKGLLLFKFGVTLFF